MHLVELLTEDKLKNSLVSFISTIINSPLCTRNGWYIVKVSAHSNIICTNMIRKSRSGTYISDFVMVIR